MRAPAIGIDLGISYSRVSVWQNGKVEIIHNKIGERKIPSYIAFTDSEKLIGEAAKNQKTRNPENTIFGFKRLIGRNFEDKEIQEDMKFWPFKVIKDKNSNRPLVQVAYQKKDKTLYSEEMCAMILQNLKQRAIDFLGKEIKDAIITVPTYFNDFQRKAIKDAGTIAMPSNKTIILALTGLNVLRIIDESYAAAIGYGFDNKFENEKNILIFDLGGGNLNISLLCLEDD